jgi:hypothetical protein
MARLTVGAAGQVGGVAELRCQCVNCPNTPVQQAVTVRANLEVINEQLGLYLA